MNMMAKTMAFGGAGFVAAAAGWLLSVYISTGNQSEFYAIELVPQGQSGTLKVNKANQCKKNPHEGCLLFEEDKVGLIKFYLPGSKYKVENCTKAKAVITRIELTTTVKSGSTNDEKGDFSVPLDDWIKDYAFPAVDTATGVVYDADVSYARTQAWLVNMNSHNAKDGDKEFWYRVTATDCDNHELTWVTDPRGDNKGSN